MFSKQQGVFVLCGGLLSAACVAQGSEQGSNDPTLESTVGDGDNAAAQAENTEPTAVRIDPGQNVGAFQRPLVSVRPELRKVATHDVDVTDIATSKSAPEAADHQEISIRLSTGQILEQVPSLSTRGAEK